MAAEYHFVTKWQIQGTALVGTGVWTLEQHGDVVDVGVANLIRSS
jgi:hypothetical protein